MLRLFSEKLPFCVQKRSQSWEFWSRGVQRHPENVMNRKTWKLNSKKLYHKKVSLKVLKVQILKNFDLYSFFLVKKSTTNVIKINKLQMISLSSCLSDEFQASFFPDDHRFGPMNLVDRWSLRVAFWPLNSI